MKTSWALTDDLSPATLYLTLLLLLLSIVLVFVEQRRSDTWSPAVVLTALLAGLTVSAAVFRPVLVSSRSSQLGPRVVVLMDASRRLELPADDKTTRARLAQVAVASLREHYSGARLAVLAFGEAEPTPYSPSAPLTQTHSDLSGALARLAAAPGERPSAVVVVSDGRFSRPVENVTSETLTEFTAELGAPVHTVALAQQGPADASIRSIRAAGAAVAHQPLAVTVEVGCSGGLSCSRVPVRIRELLHGEPAVELARGDVQISGGTGKAELEVTLERAGSRVLEFSMMAPDGDEIRENDTRYVTFSVAKERIRLLHLAGRPTYDVRALRMWLKSDESVDVVAFFILRGETDDPGATERDLALIRFPVDELFTDHLPSFDAVILQDIDAIRYKLSRYLPRLERYVKNGGGLIMVGGPASFGGGNYAGTPLDSILPVEQPRGEHPLDSTDFVPAFTESGRVAPITRKLRSLLGGELPTMSGANLLGAARPGAMVLWEHPKLSVGDRGMPILALGEAGDGRSIALAVDSTHRLAFGQLAATVSGRAYGALWDGLLGWLMRDPRYEAARVELVGECIVGQPTKFRVHRLPGMSGDIKLTLEPLTGTKAQAVVKQIEDSHRSSVEVEISGLKQGGYAARAEVGAAPATRQDFGCESGGEAWADSRPDPARLQLLSDATGGRAVTLKEIAELPEAQATEVTATRTVAPLLPAWVWTLVACVSLGGHWFARRQTGLA